MKWSFKQSVKCSQVSIYLFSSFFFVRNCGLCVSVYMRIALLPFLYLLAVLYSVVCSTIGDVDEGWAHDVTWFEWSVPNLLWWLSDMYLFVRKCELVRVWKVLALFQIVPLAIQNIDKETKKPKRSTLHDAPLFRYSMYVLHDFASTVIVVERSRMLNHTDY